MRRLRSGAIFDDVGGSVRAPARNWMVGGLVAIVMGLLFLIDATNPRGVLDGVGYPAAIALGGSLGRRALFGIAIVATLLTIAAFFLTPPGGVDLVGTLANRSFAIASVWIVTFSFAGRVRLERQLANSGAWFRSLFDQLPVTVSIHDLDDRFLQSNRANEQLLGLTRQDIVGRTRQEVWSQLGMGDVPRFYVDRVLETLAPVQTAPLRFSLHGEPRWFIGTAFPILDADGRAQAVGTAAQDITDFWLARQELEVREAALERFQKALNHAVRSAGIFERPYLEAVRALTEIAGTALGVDRTAVFHAASDDRLIDRIDIWIRTSGLHLPPGQQTNRLFKRFTASFERDRVIVIDDTDLDARTAAERDFTKEIGARAMVLAPIFIGGELYGEVAFSHTEGPHHWTAEETSFARSVADLIGMLSLMNRYRETLAALDLIDESIYVQSDDDRVIYANRAAMALVESAASPSPENSRGLPAALFPRPDHILESTDDKTEITAVCHGASHELEIKRRRLPTGGIVVVINDKTAQRADQAERERLQEQLQQAMKIEAIGLLAAGIAHDFNNLLGAISGFARFLEQDLPSGTAEHQFARRILSACQRGKTITSQILMFAQSKAEEKRATDVGQVARDCVELLRGLVSPSATFDFACSEASMPLNGDDGQIVQLLVNLCTNANAALGGRPGCISLRVSRLGPDELDLDSKSKEGGVSGHAARLVLGKPAAATHYALIRVRDSGAGIDPKILPHIFEPFFSRDDGNVGTGLGLAVVRRVVSAHDGALSVDSAPGEGACFSIYLPLDEQVSVEGPPPQEPKRLALRGSERVLIVDDEVDITDMLSIGLDRLGYEVASVNEPEEALADFQRDPDIWDVVVTDQRMPGMDGLTLARRLKTIRRNIKVILCTGVASSSFLQQPDPILDGVFLKPVSPEQIAGAIRSLAEEVA